MSTSTIIICLIVVALVGSGFGYCVRGYQDAKNIQDANDFRLRSAETLRLAQAMTEPTQAVPMLPVLAEGRPAVRPTLRVRLHNMLIDIREYVDTFGPDLTDPWEGTSPRQVVESADLPARSRWDKTPQRPSNVPRRRLRRNPTPRDLARHLATIPHDAVHIRLGKHFARCA